MTEPGDDCYFFYYSNCAKGDSCPFRHCEAAMGSETVCNLWQEGRCFRKTCKFRHMEIKKNRKEIACYWENQPAGCQKPHCAFRHEKPRIIDGIYVPASKVLGLNEEPPHEEPVIPSPAPLPTASNPQLRGVMKAETQENVPSPTHPPVVINPADDDEDEDDQFSEEGEDGTRIISPRKLSGGPNSGQNDLLNFGVRTLEEIRLRKALKASMKRAGYPVQSSDSPVSRNFGTNGEKENISSFVRPTLFPVRDDTMIFEETEKPRVSIVDRLGKNILRNDELSGETPLLKGRLANRLGRIVGEEDTDLVPQKPLKPVRDRLGRSVEPAASADPAIIIREINKESEKSSEKIRIKTLEEIRQEKAAKAQTLAKKGSHAVSTTTKPTTATKPATRGSKRAITVKSSSVVQVKTFSEVLHAKRKQQEEDQHKDQVQSSKKTKHTTAEASKKPMVSGSTDTTLPSRLALPVPEVKVKTLEEIRREKVARKKAEAGRNPGTDSSSEESTSKKPQILHINKPASPSSSNNRKTAVVKEKPEEPTTTTEPNPISGNILKVKTFEEIMREKRLRKQQLVEQATSTSQSDGSAEKELAPKPMASPTLESKALTKVMVMPPDAPAPVPHTTAPKTSVRQRGALQTEVALRVPSTTTASASPKLGSPPQQAEADSPSRIPKVSASSPTKRKRTPPGPIAAKQSRGAASPGLSGVEPPIDTAVNAGPKKSMGKATEAKVRPKLNVKPSMMKPAAQVRPGQKRKAAERSAVAAVKPLNSSASESPFEQDELADAKLSATVPGGPSTQLGPGSNSSPLREELQAVPVKSLPTVSSTSTTAVRETCPVPQSSVTKTAPQSRPRRISTSRAAPTTTTSSAVDDFDELMNEFTDDHLELEGDMELDHGKGEDDLLLELSEMIDS